MSTVAEIEEAIAKLPLHEFRALLDRMKDRDADAWDRQIETDAKDGRLDGLYLRLKEAEGDQPKIPLDEVLDDPKFS